MSDMMELERKVADAMEELEHLHRAMATEPWVKDLPLDPVTVTAAYFLRVLAARRMEALGCYGADECAQAAGESGSSVRLALEREDKEIARILEARRPRLT
jgi:hypothetical protein